MSIKLKLSAGPVLPRDMNERQWASWAGNQKTEYVKAGQDGYNDGTGYFLGYDVDGIPKLSIGISNQVGITWDGSTFNILGNLTWSDSTPIEYAVDSWAGFSADPTTTFWVKSFSGLTFLTTKLAGTGTSNSTSFSLSISEINAPIAISSCYALPVAAIDDGNTVLALPILDNAGNISFSKFDVATGRFNATGWTNSGTKGLPKYTTLEFYYPAHLWA